MAVPKGLPHSRATINRFWNVYNKTGSVAEAIRRSGVGRTWAYAQTKGIDGGDTMAAAVRKEDKRKPPPRLDELGPVARDCLDDFGRFRARYLGSISVPWQEECAHRVVALLDSPEDAYAVVNSPQGGGKTRFFSHDLPAWLTCRDRSLRGILGSLGLSLSKALVGNLRDTLGRTVPVQPREQWVRSGLALNADKCLVDDYGRFQPLRDEGGSWSADKLTVVQFPDLNGEVHPSSEKEPTWAGFSYEARFLGWRVDFMVWDDLVNTSMLRNPDQVEALQRWWDDEAESRLDPGGLCLLVGQRLRSNDIYRYALDKAAITDEIDAGPDNPESPRQYTHFVYKAHYDDKCVGEHGVHAPVWPDGCMLDPKRVTWRKIRAKQNAGNYAVVYQQEDSDPTNVLVHPRWINGGVHGKVDYPGCWDDRATGDLPDHINPSAFTVRYLTVDPSPTKWWGIIDTLYVLPPDVEPLSGDRHIVDICRERMGVNEFLDWSQDQVEYVGLLEDWVQRARKQGRPVTHLIMERNAAQRWASQYSFFQNWLRSRGVNLIHHETTSNKLDANFGVDATIPPIYKHGRVRLPNRGRLKILPLVQELTTYPDGATDDLVMSQWFGEFHLQHLVSQRTQIGSLWSDIPSWVARNDRSTSHRRRVARTLGVG